MTRSLPLVRCKMSRLDLIFFLALSMLLIFPAVSRAQQSPPVAEQIAKVYGLDSFGQVEAIRYTWNAEFPGGHKVSNKWEWVPKTGTVSYEGKDKQGNPVKVTYQRSQLDGQSDVVKKEVDPAFANDQYWTLLPFHLLWDGASATDEGQQKLPIGDGTARKVAMKYPSEGGYQPGDTWDLYVGPDERIVAITYHRGAPNPPHLVSATYAAYKKAGPLLISTDHPGIVDGKDFRITLTDVSLKLAGSDKWIDAH
ncbi:hypothetical protein [Bradyrhizobium sp. NAS80.1]|uniref:hypothetical protein n=1 Tax=Bradyrhizobium sp. NAS80.1 TaxID=1680159 RepID=UPI000AD06450|nr:hypothetical protein [Bradyrhizobium sp. NAS80.1]